MGNERKQNKCRPIFCNVLILTYRICGAGSLSLLGYVAQVLYHLHGKDAPILRFRSLLSRIRPVAFDYGRKEATGITGASSYVRWYLGAVVLGLAGIYETARQGTIEFITDGETLRVKTER